MDGGGWCGWLEQLRVKLSQLKTKLKLKVSLSKMIKALPVVSHFDRVEHNPKRRSLDIFLYVILHT